MLASSLPFTLLTPGLAIGTTAPDDWQRLTTLPLLIVVGVTGVGKSTTLQQLTQKHLAYSLLPNRRVLTDQLIISPMQADENQPVQPVHDRQIRFDYTRRYRQRFAGGMSDALSQLWLDRKGWDKRLLFDGLRGVDEVAHAIVVFPQARFIVLHAPDAVRVQRLLGRNDTFDQIASEDCQTSLGAAANPFASMGLPEAQTLFNAGEARHWAGLIAQGSLSATDLRAKLQIVLEERRNYDQTATLALLRSAAPTRTLAIDTAQVAPTQVAEMIVAWVKDDGDRP